MKNKLLKTLAVTCALTMMVGTLGACAPKEAPETDAPKTTEAAPEQTNAPDETQSGAKEFENKQLEVAAFEGGFGKAYIEAVIEKFEAEYPGVEVTLVSSPKIYDIITPRLVSGDVPDVICGDGSAKLPQLAAEGALADLTDVFEQNVMGGDVPLKDMIFDGTLEGPCSPTEDGKIYLAPTDAGAQGLYYNKTLFEEKGWTVPTTWDEFFALGDVAKEEGIALYTYQGIYPSYNEMVMLPALASTCGMDKLNEMFNYKEGTFDTEEVRKVLGVYEKIASGDYLMEGTVAMNHTQAQSEFLKGKALFCPNGSWFENEMKDAIPESGFTFGFTPAPVFDPADQRYIISGCGYHCVTKDAKNPELAKEFIRFMYREDNVRLLAEKNTSVMPVKGSIDLVKDLVPESVYNTFKAYDNAAALTPGWKVVPTASVAINDELYNPISSMMNGEITVDEWVERVEAAFATLREESAQ